MNLDQECSGIGRAAEPDHPSGVLSPTSAPRPIPGAPEPSGHVNSAEVSSLQIPNRFYTWCLEIENPAWGSIKHDFPLGIMW